MKRRAGEDFHGAAAVTGPFCRCDLSCHVIRRLDHVFPIAVQEALLMTGPPWNPAAVNRLCITPRRV